MLPITPQLLTAANFVVLSATPDVTNTGNSVLTGGFLGVYPAAAIIGFPPGIIVPDIRHAADPTGLQAQSDANAAYTTFQGLPGGTLIVGNLAGQILAPGIYKSASSMDLSVGGTLTLDGGGDPNAVFIFQLVSALTLNNGSTIKLQNGATAANVLWAVGSSAVVGTTATVVGTIIASASVSLAGGASLAGRAIALTGEVTLEDVAITVPTFIPPIPPIPPRPIPVNPNGPSANSFALLSEVCFPDITGKTIRAWGIVTIFPGGYTKGGMSMGLVKFADDRTVDFNGFLKADVWGEEPSTSIGLFEYHYSPIGDVLQLFNADGTELANGAQVPLDVLQDILMFEATWDRTTVRG